jgi:hypothetical protein
MEGGRQVGYVGMVGKTDDLHWQSGGVSIGWCPVRQLVDPQSRMGIVNHQH